MSVGRDTGGGLMGMGTAGGLFTEEDRLRMLRERPDEAGPGAADRLGPGAFGGHELLDRANLAGNLVEETILNHPACRAHPEWFDLAEVAVDALRDLYRKVGEWEDDEDDQEGGMAYRKFTLQEALTRFHLGLVEVADLHAADAMIEAGAHLPRFLEEYLPLAQAIDSEKARSELIISPVLLEVRAILRKQIGYFSGVTLNVDRDQGLAGICDFLLTRSPVQLYLESPIVAVVEAKNDDVKGGIGQCVAEMVAARLFNERKGRPEPVIHGAVTTGTTWKFLRLEGRTVTVDQREYHAPEHLGKILGIFVGMFADGPPVNPPVD